LLRSTSVSFADEADVDRVKRELPAAAKRLDQRFAQIRGTARLRYEQLGLEAKLPLTEAHFAIDHGMEKVELVRTTSSSKPIKLADIIYCVGKDTAFQLYRRAGASAYEIKGIGRTTSDRNRYLSLFGWFVVAHHGVMGHSLTQFLESPGFEITGAEVIAQDGKRLMKVDCLTSENALQQKISLVLDPESDWLVRSCRYQPGSDPASVFSFEIEYAPIREGLRLPLRVKVDEAGGGIQHCDFTEWSFAHTPVSEFNMTHYGLPDMVHTKKPANTLPFWLAGLGVLTAAIALVIRRRTSRRSLIVRA
jgi:hypothetical protein